MAVQNQAPQFKVAIYREEQVFDTVIKPWRDSRYRLIVPIAVKRVEGGIAVVKPVWEQCISVRGPHIPQCAVYFSADVDAIVYLREWIDAWREVEVLCYCGDTEFCRALEACARNLWQGRVDGKWLGSPEVAELLPRCWQRDT